MAVEESDFLMLVGLGASAGGVEALMRFFERMPGDAGMAYVVILHLSPEHESHLAEVLRAKTKMPVLQVNEPVRVEPNHVYVVPPDRDLYMDDGHIQLAARGRENGRSAPVDLFFRTLAENYRERAIAVVLSGAGTDGSVGVRRVKELGGVVLAQEPSEAEHAAMPRGVMETGAVDFVMAVEAMPGKLVSLRRNAERIQLPDPGEPPPDADEDALREVLALLRARTRHDFSGYKRSTLLRRVERRMQVTQTEDLPAYLAYVREHPEELLGLLSDLLISVTNFFRDREAFHQLEHEVVPLLFEGKRAGEQVRVWVAGCATGEEAYSLAMLLSERAEQMSSAPAIQVFASDIDEEALRQAREGVYPEAVEADIPPERLKRFFVKEGQYYRVRRELRERVLFAPHNVLRDPPFSKLDLVSCRNLLIYINRQTQEQVLEVFHFALRPGGYLFLGSSETAEALPDLFTPLDKKHRVFRRLDGATAFRGAPALPVTGRWAARLTLPTQTTRQDAEPSSYGELHFRALEALAPPSVLVNADYEIVHLSESAGRFLRFAGGEPTRNLLKVAHPELQMELRSLLLRAEQGSGASRDVPVILDGGRRVFRVTVRPVVSPRTAHGFRLVVFEELPELAAQVKPARPGGASAAPAAEAEAGLEPLVRQLEEELQRVREQLRATVEMYETQAEEFKAANEELQAMNEELRSASEEMETSKEELQSVNEEMTTVNNELKEKIEEVGRANSDLQNLLAATQIATLFLDRSLRIKRYTPGVQKLFNLIPGDVGRPVAHLTHKLDYEGLVEDAEAVLRTLHTTEREATARTGHSYLIRLLPYRTHEDRIDGVVITFVDITAQKRAEQVLRESETRLAIDLVGMRRLYDLHARLATETDLKAALEEILAAACEFTHTDRGCMQLVVGDGRRLEMFAWRGYADDDPFIEHFRDEGFERGGDAARVEHKRCLVPDTVGFHGLEGTAAGAALAASGIRAVQATPVVSPEGKAIGVLSTQFAHPHVPADDELRLIDLLAWMAANFVERHRATVGLRESEERMRLVVESVSDYAIFTADLEGRILSWNPGAESMFGYAPEEAVGQNMRVIFTPEDRERGAPEEEMRQAREKGRAADERWHIRKGGARLYVSGVLAPLLGVGGELTGYAKIGRDLTERRELEVALGHARDELEARVEERTRELQETTAELLVEVKERAQAEERARSLLRQIVTVQEEERRRIARELHDTLGQQLAALRLSIDMLKAESEGRGRLLEHIGRAQAIFDRLNADVDFLAWELRPAALDRLGLDAALRTFVREWSEQFGLEAIYRGFGDGAQRLVPEVETNLYRILQEALQNVHKHAEATHVSVILEQRDGQAVLIVEDNGRGYDAEAEAAAGAGKGMGLTNMRERAALLGGELEIESAPGAGTTVYVRVPVNGQELRV